MDRTPLHHAHADHPAESAGRHLVQSVMRASPSESVGQARARLFGAQLDYTGSLYLVDDAHTLLGAVPMAAFLAAAAQTQLASLSQPACPVHVGMDQEHIASHAIRHSLVAVPVIDARGRLLGVVPPLVLLEVLRHEHVEDIHRLAGIRKETVQARHAIEAPPVRRARDRLPWLLIGLAGSMLATSIVVAFESALSTRVALAFFIPGIVYLADAIGTQTEAIAVRGLSLSHAPLGRLVAGELRTGLLIGLTLGAVSFPCIWLVFGEAALAFTVSLSLLAAGAVATTVGLLLPWLLARLGRDPAFGSGPIATIIQDVLSLVIYFAIASAILL